MKNLFLALIALLAVGCSKPSDDPSDDPRVKAIIGTEWEYVEENVSAFKLEFTGATQAWLTKMRWEYHEISTYWISPGYEEFSSSYCYDYTVSDNGEISMKIAALSNWYPDDGINRIIPDDYKDMPPLLGSVSGISMSLRKIDGATYATLERKINPTSRYQ